MNKKQDIVNVNVDVASCSATCSCFLSLVGTINEGTVDEEAIDKAKEPTNDRIFDQNNRLKLPSVDPMFKNTTRSRFYTSETVLNRNGKDRSLV